MKTQKDGVLGITNMSVHHGVGEATRIKIELIAHPNYDPHHMLTDNWKDMFPGVAIVKCGHCGQWAARKTECKHCGAAVD